MGARRRRAILPGLLLGSVIGLLVVAALRPQWVLEAEFARQRWMAGASTERIEIDGQRWTYLQAGEGPPLILLHGFTGAKENWLPIMGPLSTRFRVLAPDLPGWGESSRGAAEDHSFAGQAARLEQFVHATGGGESVFLVGHSMGGGVAAMWAAQQPGALKRLVLLDAAGLPFENAFAQLVRAGEHPFEVNNQEQFERQLSMVFKRPPWIPWPADRALIERRQAKVDFEREVLAAVASDEQQAFAPGEAAHNIKVPTLMLWCRDDQSIDVSVANAYAERIAGSSVVMLEDCNHMPMMEQPEETAQILLEFFSVAALAD